MMTDEEIRDFVSEWPDSWMGLEEDIAYGEQLISIMSEFIHHLIDKGLADKTICRHMDNLWLLGGVVIRDVSDYEEYDVAPWLKLSQLVSENGGPWCRHLDSGAARISFDATCRKLHKFMHAKQESGSCEKE